MERPTRHSALWQVTRFECLRCLDTALVLKDGALFDCPACHGKHFDHQVRIAHLETAALKQKPVNLDERTFDAARALVLTNRKRPLKLATLSRFLNCPDQSTSLVITRLQTAWQLPISVASFDPVAYCWAD